MSSPSLVILAAKFTIYLVDYTLCFWLTYLLNAYRVLSISGLLL